MVERRDFLVEFGSQWGMTMHCNVWQLPRMFSAQSVLQQFNWHFNKDKTKDRILWEIIFQNDMLQSWLPTFFFSAQTLGRLCAILARCWFWATYKLLQHVPFSVYYVFNCIQNAIITGFPNQPRTYFHAHILFHEWSAVAISIYIYWMSSRWQSLVAKFLTVRTSRA